MNTPTQPGNGPFGPPGHPPPYRPYQPQPPTAPPAVGLILVLAGLLTLGLGMAVLDWLTWHDDVEWGGSSESATLNGVAGAFFGEEGREVIGGYEHAYLQYLSWLTAFAAALTATLAAWPGTGSGPRSPLRGLAVLLAVFGLVSTVVLATSLSDVADEAEGMSVSAGPWVAVAGFAVLGLGALLGPARSTGGRA